MSPIQTNQIIHLKHGKVQVISDNIFYVKFNGDTLLEVEDFLEAQHQFNELSADKPMKILVEFMEFTSATREARKYAEEIVVDAVAGAIVFNGLAQRILVQAYQLFNSQKHPVKSFLKKEKAINWLDSK